MSYSIEKDKNIVFSSKNNSIIMKNDLSSYSLHKKIMKKIINFR